MSQRSVTFVGECMVELFHRPGDDADMLRRTVGGDTLNAAVYCARALGERASVAVRYATRIGDDPFGRAIPGFIEREGVSAELVELAPGETTGLYAISRDAAGERSFSYWRAQSAARQLFADGRDDELEASIEAGDALFFSGITLAVIDAHARERLLDLARRMRASGKLVGFDGNYRPRLWESAEVARDTIRLAHGVATVTLPGLDDERALFGEETAEDAARRLLDHGASAAVVKRGGEPTVILDAGGLRTCAAPPLPGPVVDTTAAGVSFDGAALAALLTGADLDAAVRAGHRMAGLVIGDYGAIVADPRTHWRDGLLRA